jgi:hypothetical protein
MKWWEKALIGSVGWTLLMIVLGITLFLKLSAASMDKLMDFSYKFGQIGSMGLMLIWLLSFVVWKGIVQKEATQKKVEKA